MFTDHGKLYSTFGTLFLVEKVALFPIRSTLSESHVIEAFRSFFCSFFSRAEQSELKVMRDNEPVLLVALRYET